MKRLAAFLPLGVLALGMALFAGYALHLKSARVEPDALVGKALPTLSLSLIEGGAPQSLGAVVQGPALVNIFASWCTPCAQEHPRLMALKAGGVRIVGVAYKDKPADTAAFLDRLGDPFAEVMSDPDGRAGIEFGISGVPETYVVGRGGVILAKHTGPLTDADAARLLAALKAAS